MPLEKKKNFRLKAFGYIVLGLALALFIWWTVSHNDKGNSSSQTGGGIDSSRSTDSRQFTKTAPGEKMKGSRRGMGPVLVSATKAVQGDMPNTISALGTVTPITTTIIKSQLSGPLIAVPFQEGKMVKKGQILAEIDPRPYQQQLAQAEATKAKDEVQLDNARLDLKRYETLASQDSIARQQRDTQDALVKQLQAQVKADLALIGAQKLNLIYCKITAPISGQLGLRQVDLGNYVTPGDVNGIVTLVQINPIDVSFTISEDYATAIATALHRQEKLGVDIYDREGKKLLDKGQVVSLDNMIDTTTGTVRVKARLANAANTLFPNQFVNVQLTLSISRHTIIIPASALLKGPQGAFVYVLDQNKKVHIRLIKPGTSEGENLAVLEGLSAGETVVTDGTDRLTDGMTVALPKARDTNADMNLSASHALHKTYGNGHQAAVSQP